MQPAGQDSHPVRNGRAHGGGSGYNGGGGGDNGSGGLDIGSGGSLRDVWDTKGNGSGDRITDGGFGGGGGSSAQPTALQLVAWASSRVRQLSDRR